jgi:hypothetical protein
VLRATGRFDMDKAGYPQLLGYVRQWPGRIWAEEGAPVEWVGRWPPGRWSSMRSWRRESIPVVATYVFVASTGASSTRRRQRTAAVSVLASGLVGG